MTGTFARQMTLKIREVKEPAQGCSQPVPFILFPGYEGSLGSSFASHLLPDAGQGGCPRACARRSGGESAQQQGSSDPGSALPTHGRKMTRFGLEG